MDRFAEPILHVDMDAFFVEVERLADPSLRDTPVIIGGLGRRGVVAAASYEAREFGVHSAMPMVEARRRNPKARFLPPDHARYSETSRRIFALLRGFTPMVEGLSVDEAFLDVSGLRLHYDDSESVGTAIRADLREEISLPASVGIATNKFIAKLASEDAKPDGLLRVKAGDETKFLHVLDVRRLWGVGEATHAALEGLGVETVGDVAALPVQMLEKRVGASLGRHLAALANGLDDRSVIAHSPAKSVSVEETYAYDIVSTDDIERELLRHCDRLSSRLRRSNLATRTIGLKLRFGEDFTTVSRSVSVPVAIEHTGDLASFVSGLLKRIRIDGRGVRLLGVSASGLVPSEQPRQLAIGDQRRSAVAEAADQVRDRFGDDAVLPAGLVEHHDRSDHHDRPHYHEGADHHEGADRSR